MMQDELMTELNKPIPKGKRNNTLFAIGNKMRLAEIEDWEIKLQDRGTQVGLGQDEITKMIENIERYGANVSQP